MDVFKTKVGDKIFDYIHNNSSFSIVDATTGQKYVLTDILVPLDEFSTGHKNLVFLYLDSSLSSLVAYLNFLRTKHAIVLLSNSIDEKLKEGIEKEYAPFIIYDEKREAITDYESVKIGDNSTVINFFFNGFFNTKVDVNIKVLLSTSGTTGSPKFVKLSDTNLLQNAISIGDYLPIQQDDVTPLNLPLHYSYGLSVLHSNAIFGGAVVAGLPDVLSSNFWKHMNNYGFTSLAGVPFVYEMLEKIGFMRKSYASLRYVTQAGGNLNEKIKLRLYEYCENNSIGLYIMYGQTEATARISHVPPQILEEKLTSIGIPIKNGFLKIDGNSDELIYTGPNVFGGYATNKMDLRQWENIKELKTGDLASQDDDGFFYIKGRIKRITKIFGNRVNLDEIENFVKSLLSAGLISCVGIEDKFMVIAHSLTDIDEVVLKKEIFENYKIQSSAIKLIYLKELPETNNGKINYTEIVKLYKAKIGSCSPSDKSTN